MIVGPGILTRTRRPARPPKDELTRARYLTTKIIDALAALERREGEIAWIARLSNVDFKLEEGPSHRVVTGVAIYLPPSTVQRVEVTVHFPTESGPSIMLKSKVDRPGRTRSDFEQLMAQIGADDSIKIVDPETLQPPQRPPLR